MRDNRWDTLINEQITRWAGLDMDMRAHGNKQEKAICSHKTKTQAHGQQNKNTSHVHVQSQ